MGLDTIRKYQRGKYIILHRRIAEIAPFPNLVNLKMTSDLWPN